MRVIHRYERQPWDGVLHLRRGRILSADYWKGGLSIWVEEDDDLAELQQPHALAFVTTGSVVPANHRFIDTVCMHDTGIVIHVYERAIQVTP